MKECYKKAIAEAERLIKENYSDDTLPIDVVMIATNCGLTVTETSLSEINGQDVAGFIDPEEKVIYVNKDDAVNRKIFTIAHELGHWILHPEKLFENPEEYAVLYRKPLGRTNDDIIEKEANCFAGNLLVPKKMLLKYKSYNNQTLSLLFGVSIDVIGFRKKLNGI